VTNKTRDISKKKKNVKENPPEMLRLYLEVMTSHILHHPGTWMFQDSPFHRPLMISLIPQDHISIATLEQEANISAFPLSLQDIHTFHIINTILSCQVLVGR
jgi:hypothetical protein